MKLFNLKNDDERDTFLKELVEYSMPIWVYGADENPDLILVTWEELVGDRVEDVIEKLLRQETVTIKIDGDLITDEDKPLYEDTDEMEDWDIFF